MHPGAETAIGLDVGGTRIRAARVDASGQLLDRIIEPVVSDGAAFREQVLRLIRTVRDETCVAVGIGIPGRVDAETGVIRSAGYLDIAQLNLPELIYGETGLPARIENDATMALIAEGRSRADGNAGVVAMVTVGTGIGGAVIRNGTPCYGNGLSGQFGHIIVSETGPRCNCGRIGCVETFSSGTAFGGLVCEAGLPEGTQVQAILDRAAKGDSGCIDLLHAWARPLQRAIQSLIAVLDPKLVLVGGGLGAEMTIALSRLPSTDKWFSLPVEAAILGDEAGVIGAGLAGFQVAFSKGEKCPDR